MTHTLGPWRLDPDGGYTIEGVFEGEWVKIASVDGPLWSHPDDGKNERYRKQREANARLILAVPDLLEALSDAATRLEFLTNWIENSYGGSNQDVELGRSYVREARGAVAYAETEREAL